MTITGEQTSASQIYDDYISIDPSIRDASEQLTPIALRLVELDMRTPIHRFVRDNVYYELAQLATAPETATYYTAQLAKNVRGSGYASALRAIHDHMPLICYGWDNISRNDFFSKIGKSITKNAALLSSDTSGAAGGRLAEQLTSITFNSGLIPGTFALPAYGRQEQSRLKVDDKKYNWDITILSNGEAIPEGEYRLQVKKSNNTATATIHPDIIKFNATAMLGITEWSPYNVRALYDSTRVLDGSFRSAHLRRRRNRIIKRFQQIKPIARD